MEHSMASIRSWVVPTRSGDGLGRTERAKEFTGLPKDTAADVGSPQASRVRKVVTLAHVDVDDGRGVPKGGEFD